MWSVSLHRGRAGAHPSSDIASQCSLRSGDIRTPQSPVICAYSVPTPDLRVIPPQRYAPHGTAPMLCARTSPQSRDCVRVRSLRLGASPLRCVPLRRRYSARWARRTGGRLSGSSSPPRRVPPVGAVFARACAPPGSVGIPPVAIRRAFAAHPASRAVRGASLLLAVLRVLCAIGPAVLLRRGR